jgi:ABC-type Fe3+/spermidine/putrescine transport system ATPase subunit
MYASKAGPVEALRGIDLAASEGEFVCLLGLSGCGKSTLLQLIAGLEAPTAGSIRVGGSHLIDVDRHAMAKLPRRHTLT